MYALNARTGKLRWRAESFSRFGNREYFYATPAVAYGRVFLGNTDGTVYAYGAGTGHLLWARQVGTYVYAAPAVWRKTLFVGTWDGYFSALDVRTGAFRWRVQRARRGSWVRRRSSTGSSTSRRSDASANGI